MQNIKKKVIQITAYYMIHLENIVQVQDCLISSMEKNQLDVSHLSGNVHKHVLS